MTRPLHRGSLSSRIAERSWAFKIEVNSREAENNKLHQTDPSKQSQFLHLWMKQVDQWYSSLGSLKCSQSPEQRCSDVGLKSDVHVTENGVSAGINSIEDSLGSFMHKGTCVSQFLETCFPRSKPRFSNNSLILSAPSNFQNKRGLALQCIMLCLLSVFVLIGIFGSPTFGYIKSSSIPKLDLYTSYRRLQLEVSLDLSSRGIFDLGTVRSKELRVCSRDMEDYVPCYNISASIEAGFKNGEEYERHCELSGTASECLVRPWKEYRIPPMWPTCRNMVWTGNVKVTRDQLLATGTRTKRLMLIEENVITFQSEDAQFMDGIENYAHQIATMIGLENDTLFYQAGIRVVLDIGCGFGSLGAHLFSRNLLTLCVSRHEAHGSQAQFALERGLPAMIGSINTRQLPYPVASFDMIHCDDCGVDWSEKDGNLLIEVDRLLKPGGYFVWTSPLANPGESFLSFADENKRRKIEEAANNMCWDKLSQQDRTAIWKKKIDRKCVLSRGSDALPKLCENQDAETSWYPLLRSCIQIADTIRWVSMEHQLSQAHLLTLPSQTTFRKGFSSEELAGNQNIWSAMIKNYWSLLTPLIFSDHPKRPAEDDPLPPFNMLRNVMDMNAVSGNFNAALLQAGKSVWVMNVIPTSAPNTLDAIYGRGFIGALHDWCEPFPTYPRTYDLLHAIGLLSQELERVNGCPLLNIFLEMDRILRPEGWVLLRDKAELMHDARIAAVKLRWETRVVAVEGDNNFRLLVCQKTFWKS